MDYNKRLVDLEKGLIIFTFLISIVKMTLSTLTYQDVLIFLPLVSVSLASRVVDYKYPKRPDLFSTVDDLNKKINDLEIKLENLEHDMTGVKFGLKTRS